MAIEHMLGGAALAAALEKAARDAPRAAGKVNGATADAIAADVQSQFGQKGWGATSSVRARRAKGGGRDAGGRFVSAKNNPTAYVFVDGGAAWQEDHPDSPQPTLRPAFDRGIQGIEARVADEVARLL